MSEPSKPEDRVTALETQVDQLKKQVRRCAEDAAAARVLAGGADRDVEEVRAELREFRAEVRTEFQNVRAELRGELRTFRDQNNRVLNTLREDMIELRNHVDKGFIEIRGRLDATAAGMDYIARLLQRLITDSDSASD